MQKASKKISDEDIASDAGHDDIRVTNDHYIKEFQSSKKRTAAIKENMFPAIPTSK